MQICPSTADRDEAMGWSTDYRPAGIEGLVIKSATGRYPTGRRDWIKVKNRQTYEVIVGAVIGSIRLPELVIAAALIDGELTVVGRTVALTTAQATDLGKHLTPADHDHPWPDEIGNPDRALSLSSAIGLAGDETSRKVVNTSKPGWAWPISRFSRQAIATQVMARCLRS